MNESHCSANPDAFREKRASAVRTFIMGMVSVSFLAVARATVPQDVVTKKNVEPVLRLTYISNTYSKDTLTPDDLIRFGTYNRTNRITGLLVYIDALGLYIQTIEGPPDDVMTLFTSIERDNRHHSLKVLERSIGLRRYAQWNMKNIQMDRHHFDDLMADSICILMSDKFRTCSS
jgi:hypothetical protein